MDMLSFLLNEATNLGALPALNVLFWWFGILNLATFGRPDLVLELYSIWE